ncbi:GIY-YIG nuclease family protein [Thermosediminibacter oceani]|uniref:Excinuclease ABC C subunit domain protein n=1 Tax=Thermosediminibacter oceani (strain ATCC BAA-1034 / DSM 16646 / JW/IW-1228P) TaxID=555079 RepID=D9RZB5_THEOJ|nr:GIY-YIG nuclease family protein [Thermosediminibacter oceani]ADL08669.1 Excinuclease ABC C subunit domain protein [Thermosediminibacter oceani DSM 16646]
MDVNIFYIHQYKFEYVCDIIPETDDNGNIIEYYPQDLYKKKEFVQLNEYGKGPFCRFKIPTFWAKKEGVYCIFSDEQLVYVGECVDLSKRFNMGYGNISPRNCFKGGQPTNCKVNNFILNEIKQGKSVKLYFLETKERFEIEKELIEKFHPQWNSQSGKNIRSNNRVLNEIGMGVKITKDKCNNIKSASVRSGGYEELSAYLKRITGDSIRLTFKEIERIINRTLPPSAYKHAAWWANGGHSHANYWLKVGWRVEKIALGDWVVFSRK